jgi:hypothetical protein
VLQADGVQVELTRLRTRRCGRYAGRTYQANHRAAFGERDAAEDDQRDAVENSVRELIKTMKGE